VTISVRKAPKPLCRRAGLATALPKIISRRYDQPPGYRGPACSNKALLRPASGLLPCCRDGSLRQLVRELQANRTPICKAMREITRASAVNSCGPCLTTEGAAFLPLVEIVRLGCTLIEPQITQFDKYFLKNSEKILVVYCIN
jgi:hypothetical protein